MKQKFLTHFFTGFLMVVLSTHLASIGLVAESPAIIDSITFGDVASETNHAFSSVTSEIVKGGLDESARKLLPLQTESWQGGSMAFTLKIDPAQPNYATIRLWGSDGSSERLILFCEGKQVGYIHLGDVDLLDFGNDGNEPPLNGRFFYSTSPLPIEMTKGKTELHFEIRSIGAVWGYGQNFNQFQKPMNLPTRGIYKFYTHTNGFFVPPANEKQGDAPTNPPVRKEPGAEVMDKLKARVNGEIKNLLASTKPLNEMQMEFLAKAYFVKWTPTFQNSNVVTQVVKGLDALFAQWRENPELAQHDPTTPNPDWFEFGPAGDAISLLAEKLKPLLDDPINDAGKKILRRAAYSEMLVAGRDWHRKNRRLYTNQSMITDMNIYLSNRGLEVVDPASALSENEVRRYLYEALSLEPWRDSDPGADSHRWNIGTNYWELTGKTLTKELGFVGYYGEVLDWVTLIYDATRPAPGLPGDEKIKARLEQIANARAPFRYPAVDADGFRAMRAETIIGWRDAHYPGNVMYAERSTWDASSLYAVAATLDPDAIGYAQQMFDDNQFFISLERQMAQANNLRVTAGLLGVPDQYELVKAQPPISKRLPMTRGQPDFVFSDEEDGVVALKNGDDILYISLYWRAHKAINFLARVHYITPQFERIAVVRQETEFEPSGLFYTRRDAIGGATPGGVHYPDDLHSAEAGEKLPIAKIPDGVRFRPGDDNVFAGKGQFYTLRYGNYLIGMNMTTDKTFELKPPENFKTARELVSGKMIDLSAPVKVSPRSTVVLWLGNHDN
ncbi:MAG TPA: hypothetical protein VGH42_12945 [Verrucomicrobiae bacterium]|jgi:hypothetical protein